jgi:hypothetical protein
MFAFEYNDNHSKHDINNRDDVMECNDITDDDALMIVIDIKNPHRDRIISSECEEMLRDLYDDIQEITVNCNSDDVESDNNSNNSNNSNVMTDSFNQSQYEDHMEYHSIKSAMKTDYEWNYTMPILTHICGYYGLKKRGSKTDIINSIVDFEIKPENFEMVDHRKKIFEFMRLIKENDYMKKFIIFP